MSRVEVEIGVKNSRFKSALAEMRQQFRAWAADTSNVGGQVSREIGKKIGVGDVSRALLGSLAIDAKGIAETIAAAISGGSREGWKAAEEAADAYGKFLEDRIRASLTPDKLVERLNNQAEAADAEAGRDRSQFGEGEGSNWFIRNSGGLIRSLANRMGWGGAETEAEALERRNSKALEAGELRAKAEEVAKKQTEQTVKEMTALAEASERVYKARRQVALAEADATGKIKIHEQELLLAEQILAATKEGTLEHETATLEVLERQTALANARLELERQTTSEKEKQARAEGQERSRLQRSGETLAEAEERLADRFRTPSERVDRLQERIALTGSLASFAGNGVLGSTAESRDLLAQQADLRDELAALLEDQIKAATPEVDSLQAIGGRLAGVNYAQNPEVERMTRLLEDIKDATEKTAAAAGANLPSSSNSGSAFGGAYNASST